MTNQARYNELANMSHDDLYAYVVSLEDKLIYVGNRIAPWYAGDDCDTEGALEDIWGVINE